jgi:hypothetical protein
MSKTVIVEEAIPINKLNQKSIRCSRNASRLSSDTDGGIFYKDKTISHSSVSGTWTQRNPLKNLIGVKRSYLRWAGAQHHRLTVSTVRSLVKRSNLTKSQWEHTTNASKQTRDFCPFLTRKRKSLDENGTAKKAVRGNRLYEVMIVGVKPLRMIVSPVADACWLKNVSLSVRVHCNCGVCGGWSRDLFRLK